jgi:hypothetical protein
MFQQLRIALKWAELIPDAMRECDPDSTRSDNLLEQYRMHLNYIKSQISLSACQNGFRLSERRAKNASQIRLWRACMWEQELSLIYALQDLGLCEDVVGVILEFIIPARLPILVRGPALIIWAAQSTRTRLQTKKVRDVLALKIR